MKKDEHLDGIFREGLSSVEPPPAPSQDWAAMARSAKTNAVLAGKGRSLSGTARWIRIIGGGMAVLVGWYLSSSPNGAQYAERAAMPVSAPLLPSLPMLETDEELPPHAASGEPGPAGMQGAEASMPSPSASEEVRAQPVNNRSAAIPSNGMNERSDRGEDGTTRDRIQEAITTQGAVQSGEALATASSVEGAAPLTRDPAGPAAIGMAEGQMMVVAGSFPEPRPYQVFPLPLLLPASSELAYQPTSTPIPPVEADYATYSRWSIAPWISAGKSVIADPDLGTGVPDGLASNGSFPNGFGLRVQYTLDRQLAFFTGISLTSKGNLQGWIRSSPTLTTEYQLSGHYIEVPVALKFTRPLRNMDLYARAGLTFLFNRPDDRNRVVMHDEGLKQLSTLALAGGSMGTAIDLGAGVQIPLNHRLGLFVEPSYQIALSPAVKHPSFDQLPFNPRIHSFSLITGLSFQFH
ncbi:MAG: hypothetical protein KA791_04525 [Flavobacteriales bacterium]|nr:hypothetical protein [Flavobacteriales bacterium]